MTTNAFTTILRLARKSASTPPAHISAPVKLDLKAMVKLAQMLTNASQITDAQVTQLVLIQSDLTLASAIKASLAMVSAALILMSAHPTCTIVMLMQHVQTKLAHLRVPALTVPRATVFHARMSTNVPELLITVLYMPDVQTQSTVSAVHA